MVTFGSAIPIILGQNIGTCITAMVHLLFNVVGVTLFVIVFYGLDLFIDWTFLEDTCAPWNIAVIHTCFNVPTRWLLRWPALLPSP